MVTGDAEAASPARASWKPAHARLDFARMLAFSWTREVTPMQLVRTRLPVFLAAIVAALLAVTGVLADDYVQTGTGIRVKTVAIVDVKVYEISHYMKSP